MSSKIIERYYKVAMDNKNRLASEFIEDDEHNGVEVVDVYWNSICFVIEWFIPASKNSGILKTGEGRFSILLWDDFYKECIKGNTSEV